MASRPFLFGNSLSSGNSKHLVEFRAGKMVMKSNNMVHPVATKGTVYVHQTEDSLIHFCWKERSAQAPEDDLIIFPDDAEFKRVAQCTTGRVYVLKFKSNPRRCFFWMQEPSDDKDDEFCRKINEYFNNPPTPGSRSAGGGSGTGSRTGLHGLDNLQDADLQNLLNNMDPQQLIQILGGGAGGAGLASIFGGARGSGGSGSGSGSGRGGNSGSSGPPTTSTLQTASRVTAASAAGTTTTVSDSAPKPNPGSVDATGRNVQLSDLQSIISGLTVPGNLAQPTASQVNVDLSSSLNVEVLKPLLTNKNFMDRVKGHLPPTIGPDGQARPVETSEVPEQLASTVSSPQFQSALSIFSSALQSGQLGPLMEQFGLSSECVAAANAGDLEQFVKAMEKSGKQQGTHAHGSGGEKKDDDQMALD